MPWEAELLRLLAEQAAVPFDQLARFLGCELEPSARIAKHLTKAGFADYGRTLAYEPHWVWLTGRGTRLSGTDFAPGPPRIGAMERLRAVNEVRLHISARAPEARWICGRSVAREQGVRGHRANAVVEIDSERHAMLVKPGAPHDRRLEISALEVHMFRYDAVACFASRARLAQLRRLQRDHHWPKLVLREIPGSGGPIEAPRAS